MSDGVANIARIYDALLGGQANSPADRQAAADLVRRFPPMADMAVQQRACLMRIVRFLAGDRGIRQFLDIGSGLPTQQNVHEVALAVSPDARIVYVDKDPAVVSQAKALLAGSDAARVIDGDVLEPDKLLADAAGQGIDFSQPVAVLILGMLHFVPDTTGPQAAVATIRAALVPGSYLAVSHGEKNTDSDEIAAGYRGVGIPGTARVRADILRFFGDFELEPPGVVSVADWGTEPGDGAFRALVCGVARRR